MVIRPMGRLEQRHRVDRIGTQDQHVERIAIVGQRLRDEAVIGGIENGGMEHAVELQQAGLLVEFVLVGAAQRNFHHGGERRRHPRIDIVPGVKGKASAEGWERFHGRFRKVSGSGAKYKPLERALRGNLNYKNERLSE
jgi:hypothetical protein